MEKKLLIVIPAYNEAENIERVVDDLIENYPQYDYLVINDGSRDRTPDICREKHYRFLDMPINVGLSDGVQAGMMYALKNGYDCALQFDGDGQHDPAYIGAMLDALEGNDIVIGSRFVTQSKPKTFRMLGSNMIERAIRLTTRKDVKDPTSGMRLYNRRMIKIMAESVDFGPEPDTLAFLMRKGAVVKEIQVEMRDRIAGESYLNPVRAVKYMARMIFSILFAQWFRKDIKLGESPKSLALEGEKK